MVDIERLRHYYLQGEVYMTQHAENRSRLRGISQDDIENCIKTGQIIEQYPDDYPFPSCLVFGYAVNRRVIHVVIGDSGDSARIVTAYDPDTITFKEDLKTRR